MDITIVTFQRKKRRTPWMDAEQEYVRRLSRHARVDLIAVDPDHQEAGLPGRLLRSTWRIGLFVDGQAWGSEELAGRIQQLMNQGRSHLVWVIGAAEGMPTRAAQQVHERWSLSPLTFGHQLARVVLLEVLYRSFDLLHGGPYHK